MKPVGLLKFEYFNSPFLKKILEEDFCADGDKDETADYGGFIFDEAAKEMAKKSAELEADDAKQECDDTDRDDGNNDVGICQGKGDADSKGVNTRGERKSNQLLPADLRLPGGFGVASTQAVQYHFTAHPC